VILAASIPGRVSTAVEVTTAVVERVKVAVKVVVVSGSEVVVEEEEEDEEEELVVGTYGGGGGGFGQ